MSTQNDASMVLGRAQKRLHYLKQNLSNKVLSTELMSEVRTLFQTYSLLMSKLATAREEHETVEAQTRLADIDRKLTAIFDAARLVTAREMNTGKTSFSS